MTDPIWSLISSNAMASATRTLDASRNTATAGETTQGTGLDKDSFMRLLLTQMQSQDPLSPMDGQAFFAQLAQLSLLEQMYQLNDTLTVSTQQQQLVQAGNLIGREVDFISSDGSSQTGIVNGVRMASGEILLDVAGEDVSMNLVTAIRAQEEP